MGTYDCDQRLEFNVTFYGDRAENSFDTYANVDISRVAANDSGWTVQVCTNLNADPLVWTNVALGGNDDYDDVIAYDGANAYRFTKIIRANEDISQTDLDILRGIFGAADNANNNILPQDYITGDVYVGTKSTPTSTDEERDLSNTISFNKFFEDYINPIDYNQNWNTSDNGEWVKFVDNDGDGKADYAFRTDSWLDEAIDTYTNKDGDTVTEFVNFNDDDTNVPNGRYSVRYMDGEAPAVGTKVICALIDNQVLVEPANHDDVTVTDYNWRTDIITTADGEYGQSGIGYADLGLQYFINTMDMKTEYVVYLDHFGYVRAYELPGETTYALVTEIYARNNANGNLVRDWPMTVELTVKDAKTTEYGLNGGSNNLFVSPNWWTQVGNYAAVGNYYNYLKPAVAHLGVPAATGYGPTVANDVDLDLARSYSFWAKNRQIAFNIDDMTKNDTFEYGSYTYTYKDANGDTQESKSEKTVSFTNVAVVNINGEAATLDGAAKLRLDGRGNVMWYDTDNDGDRDVGELPRYAVDYVQLTKDNTVAGQTRYPIDTVNYTGWIGNAANNYVSATHDTEYYIVYNGGVYYFTDYTKMPKLTMDDNNIHAAYAVARDTSADNANEPYWVADVIVYEVENWIDTSRTSTALVYYNPSRNDAQIQRLNVLDSANGKVDAIPADYGWNSNLGYWNNFADYQGLGFYQFWDGEMQENGELAVGDIVHIDGTNVGGVDLRWNSNLIYAGTVVNEVDVATRGTYLNVDTDGDGNTNVSLLVKPSDESNVYSVTTDNEVGSRWDYNEANTLRYNNIRTSEIKAGDRIIWIGTSAINPVANNNTQSASFVVDLGNQSSNYAIWQNTARFLAEYPANNTTDLNPNAGLWLRIMNEQGATKTTNSITINEVVMPDTTAGDNEVLGITVTPDAIALDVETQAITFGNLGAYAIDKVEVLNTIDGKPAAAVATVGTTWTLFNIKGDVQLKITLKDAPADPTDGHTITVTYTGITPAAAVPANKTFTVADGADWFVTASEIVETVPGFSLNAVTNTTDGGTITLTFGGYGIAAVTGNKTVTVSYNAVTTSFQATTAGANPAGAAFQYKLGTDAAWATDATTAVTTLQDGTSAIPYGAPFELRIPAVNVNSLYTYTAAIASGTGTLDSAEGTKDAAGNLVFSGTITGAAVVTITETKGDVATLAVVNGGSTVTFTAPATGMTANGGDVLPTDTVTFTVNPAANTKITGVTYQISGTPAVAIDAANISVNDTTGVWTVTLPDAAKVAGKTTTITVTSISTTAQDLTFTSTYTGTGLVYSLNGGPQTTVTAGASGKISVKPGDVLVITGNDAMTVTETGGNWTPAATIDPATGDLSVTVTIPNISAAVGLTIADKP